MLPPTPQRDRQARDMSKAGRSSLSKRFLGDRRGSTALEFAMLAVPFALLVFAILESLISFAGQEVMANITDDVARQLRTGQIRQANVSEATLKATICSRLEIMVAKDCPGLEVDLRAYPSFAAAAQAGFKIQDGEIELTGTDPAAFTVAPGLAESINMLRVFYKWPVMTDFMAKSMANLKDGNTLHFASMTWQNEPFDN